MSYFPLFLDLSEKRIFVAGGGTIAERRIRAILPFVKEVAVVAERPAESLSALVREYPGRLFIREKTYEPGDLEGAALVLACTDDRELNRRITEESRRNGIPVNNASDKTDCDFYFPGLVVKDPFVVGITAGGNAHRLVKEVRIRTEEILEDIIGTTEELRIGSRESRLAVIQAELVGTYVKEKHPETAFRYVTMKTTGDRILHSRLDEIGGKGLFVKELDEALRNRSADITVHSLKDMPMEIPEDLPVLGFSEREDPRDVLVLPEGAAEPDLSKPFGTSSRRRILQIRELYPEAHFESVRGNVLTRLKKLDEGQYGALILAGAGLKRLGLEHRISRYFSVEEVIPSAGQGILAVQGRAGETFACLEGFFDRNSLFAAAAERAFVRALGGGCTSPIAAHAQFCGAEMTLRGFYYDEEKDIGYRRSITKTIRTEEDCRRAGEELAEAVRGGNNKEQESI